MSPADVGAVILIVACAALSAALAAIDARTHRLPNRLVLPLYPAAASVAVLRAVSAGDPAPLGGALLGGAALFAGYYALHRAGGGMGGGDVKLAGALGILTGAFGWQVPLVATVGTFVAGGLAAVVLLARRRADRGIRIPFGPFMVAGAWVAVAASSLGA